MIRVHTCISIIALTLSGCQTLGGSEAGISRHHASFGEAYQHNELVQTASLRGEKHIQLFQDRFNANTPDNVTFSFDRATLDSSSRSTLDAQAKWLRENPTVRIRITGHTDLVGGESYNDRLGLRRARAAARYLIRRGIARSRIDMIGSRGENEPVIATEERERRNRRAVTEVAGFSHGYVGDGMDGRRARLMFNRYISDTVETPAEAVTDGSGG